jgi:hypothetical protein
MSSSLLTLSPTVFIWSWLKWSHCTSSWTIHSETGGKFASLRSLVQMSHNRFLAYTSRRQNQPSLLSISTCPTHSDFIQSLWTSMGRHQTTKSLQSNYQAWYDTTGTTWLYHSQVRLYHNLRWYWDPLLSDSTFWNWLDAESRFIDKHMFQPISASLDLILMDDFIYLACFWRLSLKALAVFSSFNLDCFSPSRLLIWFLAYRWPSMSLHLSADLTPLWCQLRSSTKAYAPVQPCNLVWFDIHS